MNFLPSGSPLNMNFSNIIYKKPKVMAKPIVSRGDAVWSPQYLSFHMEGRDEVWLPKTDILIVILFLPFLESLTTYFLAHWHVGHFYTSLFLLKLISWLWPLWNQETSCIFSFTSHSSPNPSKLKQSSPFFFLWNLLHPRSSHNWKNQEHSFSLTTPA